MKPVSSAHVTLRFRVGKPVLCTAPLPRIKRSKPSDSSCGTRCNAEKAAQQRGQKTPQHRKAVPVRAIIIRAMPAVRVTHLEIFDGNPKKLTNTILSRNYRTAKHTSHSADASIARGPYPQRGRFRMKIRRLDTV